MSVLWDNYAKTTAHLSMIEHGAYRLLLDHYMQTGGKLKANEEQLLRVCRAFAREEKQALLSVLGQFFEQSDGHYIHAHAEEALAKRSKLAEIRAKAGAIGGAKSKPKRQATDKHLLPSSLPSSLSQKEEKTRERAGSTKSPAPLASSEQPVDSRWEQGFPKWLKVRQTFGDTLWLSTFGCCRPNGSETSIIAPSKFWAEKLDTQFSDKLERVFGEPVTFKFQEEAKP
jgi:uncharacterized protein YdaU (DUF1376 family)